MTNSTKTRKECLVILYIEDVDLNAHSLVSATIPCLVILYIEDVDLNELLHLLRMPHQIVILYIEDVDLNMQYSVYAG